MNRRNVLIGLGTAAAGAGIVFGSGAFTQASAERDVTIRVDEDSEALLALIANDDLESVRQEDGKLEIDSDLLGGGDGFNRDAEVEIGSTDDDEFGVGDVEDGGEAFKVGNNFDQEIEVTVDVEDVQPDDDGELTLVLTGPGEDVTDRSTAEIVKTLDAGEELLAALEFDTDEGGAEGEITFTAEPT